MYTKSDGFEIVALEKHIDPANPDENWMQCVGSTSNQKGWMLQGYGPVSDEMIDELEEGAMFCRVKFPALPSGLSMPEPATIEAV